MPVWTIGVDPGFGTTGVVLLKDDEPVACEANGESDTLKPAMVRTMRMALWFFYLVQRWISQYNIKKVTVLIETPILRSKEAEIGVTTMMLQMRMLASYEAVLVDIDDSCEVWVGEVHNQTAKAVFTGSGNAAKEHVISNSVWAYRPDVDPHREHLADAQAVGNVAPPVTLINCGAVEAKAPSYVDAAIGKGPKWKNKHPKTRR